VFDFLYVLYNKVVVLCLIFLLRGICSPALSFHFYVSQVIVMECQFD